MHRNIPLVCDTELYLVTIGVVRPQSGMSLRLGSSLLTSPFKWSKIMRGKAIEDRKKSQRFSKAVTEIIAAARSEPDRVPYTSSLIQTLPS